MHIPGPTGTGLRRVGPIRAAPRTRATGISTWNSPLRPTGGAWSSRVRTCSGLRGRSRIRCGMGRSRIRRSAPAWTGRTETQRLSGVGSNCAGGIHGSGIFYWALFNRLDGLGLENSTHPSHEGRARRPARSQVVGLQRRQAGGFPGFHRICAQFRFDVRFRFVR